MLKEFRRDSLAFAMRTASVLADFCFGFAPLWELPIAGFIGVGIVEVLPTGWVFIGPVIDLLLGIVDNSAKPSWFERSKNHDREPPALSLNALCAMRS